MEIGEDYIKFETAKLLKEKRFDIPCNYYFYEKYYAEMLNRNRESLGSSERFTEGGVGQQLNRHHKGRLYNRNQWDTTTSRPTQALVIKWLRIIHNIHISVDFDAKNWFEVITYLPNKDREIRGEYKSPEEAIEAAILYCLTELIK